MNPESISNIAWLERPMRLCDFGTLTADEAGVGGVIKQRNEDFLVEEVPLYEPSGDGEHLYLFVEKNGRTTSDVQAYLANAFRISRRQISFAGLKDKHAIARQHFSIHLPLRGSEEDGLKNIDNDRIKLLWASRHGNKLRRGHLRGNRFVIYIRDVNPADVLRARRMLERLDAAGVPNFIGDQRFGFRHMNHRHGHLLLQGRWQELLDQLLGNPSEHGREASYEGRVAYEAGDYHLAIEKWPRHLRFDRPALDMLRQGKSAKDAVMTISKDQRNFMVSALQSAMFNVVLDQRLASGTFDRLLAGDIAMKHPGRAVFEVDEQIATMENAPGGRIEKGEVSPTGPMWGPDMMTPRGEPLEQELRVLHAFDLSPETLASQPQCNMDGSRRPLRIFIREPDISSGVDEHGPYIRTAFELPRGSFATVVMREIMKTADLEGREA